MFRQQLPYLDQKKSIHKQTLNKDHLQLGSFLVFSVFVQSILIKSLTPPLTLFLEHALHGIQIMTVQCIFIYYYHLSEGKPLFIYIKLPFLNEAGFLESEKIWGGWGGEKGYFDKNQDKLGKIRDSKGFLFSWVAEIFIFQNKSENFLNVLNFWNLAPVWNLKASVKSLQDLTNNLIKSVKF